MAPKIFRGAGKFFKSIGRGFNKAVNYVEKKALPTIERVAGKIAKGIDKYGIPIVAVTAPELLPAAYAARAVAGATQKGAKQIRGGIGTGRQIVASAKKGDVGGVIQGGQKLRKQAEGLVATGQSAAAEIEGSGIRDMKNPLKR